MVQLKGLCTGERAAAVLHASEPHVAEILAEHEHLLKATPRGTALTADGRAWVEVQLAAERAAIDSAALEPVFAEFLPLNRRFKELVTGAQQGAVSGADPSAWPALRDAMRALHEAFAPLVDAAGLAAPRLANYRGRFDNALDAFAGGDHSMLASPLKDSYHTVWFEFHEELIALTGRDRAIEEAAGH